MPQQPQGTGFTNLSQFLQANQNNNLGGAVSSNISGQANNINNTLNQAYGNFQQAASANALGTPQQQQASQSALNQIIGGNTNVDPTQAAQFQQYLGGQYQGPTSLNQGQAAQLSTQANNLNSQLTGPNGINTNAGRENILKNVITNPNYTQGEQTLDATLLGQNQGALRQAKQSAAGLGQAIQQKTNAANAIGQQNVNQAQDFAGNVSNQLQQASASVDTNVNNQVANEQAQQANGFGQALQSVNGVGTLANDQSASLLGLTPEQFANIQTTGVSDLTPYLSNAAITTGGVVTPQQIAQYQALSQLSGKPITDITQIPTAGTGGTALQPGQIFNLDTNALNQAAQQNQQQASTQLGQINKTIAQMTQPSSSGTPNDNNGAGVNLTTSGDYSAQTLLPLLTQKNQLQSSLNQPLMTAQQAQSLQQNQQAGNQALSYLFQASGNRGNGPTNVLQGLNDYGLSSVANSLINTNNVPQQISTLQQALTSIAPTDPLRGMVQSAISELQPLISNQGVSGQRVTQPVSGITLNKA